MVFHEEREERGGRSAGHENIVASSHETVGSIKGILMGRAVAR